MTISGLSAELCNHVWITTISLFYPFTDCLCPFLLSSQDSSSDGQGEDRGLSCVHAGHTWRTTSPPGKGQSLHLRLCVWHRLRAAEHLPGLRVQAHRGLLWGLQRHRVRLWSGMMPWCSINNIEFQDFCDYLSVLMWTRSKWLIKRKTHLKPQLSDLPYSKKLKFNAYQIWMKDTVDQGPHTTLHTSKSLEELARLGERHPRL